MKTVFILQSTKNRVFLVFGTREAAERERLSYQCALNVEDLPVKEFRDTLVIYPKFVFES